MVMKQIMLHSLGRHFGIRRGYDCGCNIYFSSENFKRDNEKRHNKWNGGRKHEADFVYITDTGYFYEVKIMVSISDFRSDVKKTDFSYCNHLAGIVYALHIDIYDLYSKEILTVCKKFGFGLFVYYEDKDSWLCILRSHKSEQAVKLGNKEKLYYLRLFSKKWIFSEFKSKNYFQI